MNRGLVAVLAAALVTMAGCSSMRSLPRPFGSGASAAAPDTPRQEQAELEARIARVETAADRQEVFLRRMNADLTAQLDELIREVRTLGERVAALGRRLDARTLGGGAVGSLAGRSARYPTDDPRVALLPGAEAYDPGASSWWDSSAPPSWQERREAPDDAEDAVGTAARDPEMPWHEAADGPDGRGAVQAEAAPGGLADPPADGRKLYDVAYQDLMQDNYQLALINFRAFLQLHPQTRLSDNAQYWIGEVYYEQRQFTVAIEEFRKVIEQYPAAEKVPAAYYKIALSFRNLRDLSTARRYLEFLIGQYPESREAQLAEERLAEF
ncbi:MAG: tol-pal system protein YbgF [Candidatus Eisenbacteria sp.]|nr:tol-pal system protein YbgF [Candidatus Eisenbacteria bacterium]